MTVHPAQSGRRSAGWLAPPNAREQVGLLQRCQSCEEQRHSNRWDVLYYKGGLGTDGDLHSCPCCVGLIILATIMQAGQCCMYRLLFCYYHLVSHAVNGTHRASSMPASASQRSVMPSYPADIITRGSLGCESSTCTDCWWPRNTRSSLLLCEHHTRTPPSGVAPNSCGAQHAVGDGSGR